MVSGHSRIRRVEEQAVACVPGEVNDMRSQIVQPVDQVLDGRRGAVSKIDEVAVLCTAQGLQNIVDLGVDAQRFQIRRCWTGGEIQDQPSSEEHTSALQSLMRIP